MFVFSVSFSLLFLFTPLHGVQGPLQLGAAHLSSFISLQSSQNCSGHTALLHKEQAGSKPVLLTFDSFATFLQRTVLSLLNAFVSESSLNIDLPLSHCDDSIFLFFRLESW